jgi:hypothetical protein
MQKKMNNQRAVALASIFVLGVGTSALVLAQDRDAFIERLSMAWTEALNAYDPDRQVGPAAIQVLNANEFITEALRSSINEQFDLVPNNLDDAEEALRDAGRILLEIADQEVFLTDASRLQSELFFVVRDQVPATTSDALKALGDACFQSADTLSGLLGGRDDVSSLRLVLSDVSEMRLVIVAFYGSEGS